MGIEINKSIKIYRTQHYRVMRYVNVNWGITAYSIDRKVLSRKEDFSDLGIKGNGIYFLYGESEDEKTSLYVGRVFESAKCASEVFNRAIQHNDNVNESYHDAWDTLIIIQFQNIELNDNKKASISMESIRSLEHYFEEHIKPEYIVNKDEPDHSKYTKDAIRDSVRYIKEYIKAITCQEMFIPDPDIDDQIVIKSGIEMQRTDEEKQSEGKNVSHSKDTKITELHTQSTIIDAMLDMLPSDIWNPDSTFLDPACTDGEYLKAILNRLLASTDKRWEENGLKDDTIKRTAHIMANQIFAIANTEATFNRTKKYLAPSHLALIEPKYFNIKNYRDEYGKNFKNSEDAYKDLIYYINNKLGTGDENMKFTVVIGNPPYQNDNNSGNGGGATALYDKFVLSGLELSERYCCFVTPIRWYADEKRVVKLKNTLLNCNSIRELHDFPSAKKVFPKSDIILAGGVCYYLLDKSYTGDCKVVEHDFYSDATIESIRPIKEAFSDIFIRDSKMIGVIRKVVTSDGFDAFYNYMHEYNYFKIRSYERGMLKKDSSHPIKLYCKGNDLRGGGYRYIQDNTFSDRENLLNRQKVYIDSVSDCMLAFPYKTLYKAFIGEPGSVCTEGYFVIGPIDDTDIANAVIKYLGTRFVRALAQVRKTSQNAYQRIYRFVPIQQFGKGSDIDWSGTIADIDQQLYKKYNLSKEEINHIESTIEPYEIQTITPAPELVANYINTQVHEQNIQ